MKHELSGRSAASRRRGGRIRAVLAPVATCWLLLVSLPAAVAQDADTYPDVSPGTFYSQAVAALDAKGVFAYTGYSEGFCPERPIDRATMAVWTVRVLDGKDPPTISETRFDDVDASGFHAPFIERMAELEVTSGCGDGSGFCPDRSVTRAEMAAFLTRGFELPEAPAPGFSDVPADAWYADYVARLAASRITVGCGDGSGFCPSQATTRAQMATFLARATGLIETPEPDPPATYKAVSSGAGHACAIRTDDTITCWGTGRPTDEEPWYSTPEKPWYGTAWNRSQDADAPEGTYKDLSIGRAHACAIATDDTITCWGNNDYGQADPPAGTYKSVSAGRVHTCAIATDGTITCWGHNARSPHGGLEGPLDAPTGTYESVSAGFVSFFEEYTCAIATDGTITCWGHNHYGQADAPSGTYRALSDGLSEGTCAIATNGTITCWGAGASYAAPAGSYQSVSTGGYRAAATRGFHACAIATDDTITCWGDNDYGQSDPPSGTYKSVSAGDKHTCAVAMDDTITCWGDEAVAPAAARAFSTVSADRHTCVIATDGAIICWGSPLSDAPAGTYNSVSAGYFYACALATDHSITCWGNNRIWGDDRYGQSEVPSGAYKSVSVGRNHACAIATDNTVTCWGDNRNGGLSAPAGTHEHISTGDHGRACAVATGNTITCWTYGGRLFSEAFTNDGAYPPAGTYKTVSAGFGHTCAISTDDTLTCWGSIHYDRVDVPSGSFLAVSAGFSHACAVATDSTIACWGDNDYGQADPPSGTYKTVSAGRTRTCALAIDASLVCWGQTGEMPSPEGVRCQRLDAHTRCRPLHPPEGVQWQ